MPSAEFADKYGNGAVLPGITGIFETFEMTAGAKVLLFGQSGFLEQLSGQHFGKRAGLGVMGLFSAADGGLLFLVEGANHTDIYDNADKIPFAKLEAFFKANLK